MAPSYPGVYKAIVMNNATNTLTVQIPLLTATAVVPAEPCLPPGWTGQLPAVNSIVWVAFEGGDSRFPVWVGTATPLAASQPPFSNAFQADVAVLGNLVSGDVSFGTLVISAPALVEVHAEVSVAIPLSSFQRVDCQPLLNHLGMDVGGMADVQLPSTSNQPIARLAATGTIQMTAAGSWDFAMRLIVGGGGATATMTNGYMSARVVA